MAGVLLLATMTMTMTAAAQSYPSRPIRVIVPSSAGGGADVVARLVGQKLAERWGQQVIVDNRPGASTVLGAELVAKSPADGYTLFFQDLTTHGINAGLYRKLPYDSVNDFAAIAMASAGTLTVTAEPAAMNAPSPITTGATRVEWDPTKALRPITVRCLR